MDGWKEVGGRMELLVGRTGLIDVSRLAELKVR